MPNSPDRPSIRPWAKGQPVDHRRLNELQGAVITDIQIHGPPGTRTIRKGNSLAVYLPTPPPAPPGHAFMRIDSALTPGGLYLAHGWVPGPQVAGTPPDPLSAELTAAGLLNVNVGGTVYYFLNLPEMESETHDLLAADGEASGYVIAFPTGVTFSDGVPLYAGESVNWKTCVPPP